MPKFKKVCPVCNETFEVWGYDFERRKTCSRKCTSIYKTGRENPKAKRQVLKVCPTCKKNFSIKQSHSDSRVYCSRECMAEGYNKPRLNHKCIVCEKEFEDYNNQWRKDAKFCSQECYQSYKVGENHWNYKHGRSKTREYEREIYRNNKEYHRAYNRRPERREVLRRHKLKRRLIKDEYDHNEWIKLLEQYNYLCFYCGVKMTYEVGPNQITRDHLQPLSKGGRDSLENIVPACRSCNSSKCDMNFWDFMVKVTTSNLQ